jgi:hypothetical protein
MGCHDEAIDFNFHIQPPLQVTVDSLSSRSWIPIATATGSFQENKKLLTSLVHQRGDKSKRGIHQAFVAAAAKGDGQLNAFPTSWEHMTTRDQYICAS